MADPKIRIRASDESGPAFRSAESNLGRLAGSAARVAGALAGTAVAAGIANLVKGAIDAADELAKLSQRTGIAVETLGGLGFAAKLAGGSMEGITGAADKLNKSLAEAASGQKISKEAFDALGISAVDATGKTKAVDVAMAEIADRFATFADGPEKVALALRLFGKAGADQIVLLNGGGTALRENIAYYQRYANVTQEVASRSEVFNDTLTKIGLVSQSLGTTLAAELLPGMQAVADEFLRIKESGSGFGVVAAGVRVAFEAITIVGANVVFVLSAIGREIVAIGNQALALSRLDIQGFRAISDAVKADGARARAELDAFERRVLGLGSPNVNDESAAERRRLGLSGPALPRRAAPRLPGGGGGGAGKKNSELDLANKALASHAERLQDIIDKTQDLSNVEETMLFLRRKGQGASIEDAAQLRSLALRADQAERLKDELAAIVGVDKALEEQARATLKAQDDALQSLDDRINELSGRAGDDQKRALTNRLEQQLQAGAVFSPEELDKIVRGIGGVNEEIEKGKSFAEEFGLTMSSAFEDALIGGKKFSDVLKGVYQDLLRIATRSLVTEPIGKMFSGAVSSGGGFGGLLGSLGSSLAGAFGGGGFGSGMANPFAKIISGGSMRADGGPVSGGMPYLVGERGPELFMPRASGAIVPNHALAGGQSITLNYHAGPGESRTSANQRMADGARILSAAGRRNN
jgi:hypothetical protein